MSMNVEFSTRCCRCKTIRQTPTNVTHQILASENPLEAYLVWLRDTWGVVGTKQEVLDIMEYSEDHPKAEWHVR